MKCRLCLQEKPLIEAHIIPKWVFRYLYPNDKNTEPLLLINAKDERSKRRPIGVYDNKILCSECDNFLGSFDEYGKKIILDTALKPFLNSDLAYEINNVNYKPLKLFFLSILWRASISKIEEFNKINLGPHEDTLRQCILREDPGDENFFSIIVSKFDRGKLHENIADKNVHMPYRIKMDGLNSSVFYLPNGYKIFIKVDKRSIQSLFKKIILKNDSRLIILSAGEFDKSKEFEAMVSIVNRMYDKYD